jgi:replicative DNA helicase
MKSNWKIKDKTLGEKAFDMKMGKIMPHDIEAEISLLGSMVIYYNSVMNIVNNLKPSDFYSEKNSKIYTAIVSIFQKGDKVDGLGIIRELKKTGELDFCGGSKYIAKLGSGDVTSETEKVSMYIIELAKKRELIALGTETTQRAYEDTTDVFELVSDVQKGIIEILSFKASKRTDFGLIASDTYQDITTRDSNVLEGMPSKFRNINELTGGYRRGTLRTVAGRPGMGKSIHLVNEAYNLSLMGYSVAIFSLEMPDREIMRRIMSIGTQIEGRKLEKNDLNAEEVKVLERFVQNASNQKIHIDDTGNINYLYLASQIKKMKLKNEMIDKGKPGLDIIFIDYLQLMKLDNENRNIGLGEITRKLKGLSKELDICVVLYSQLNRGVESRGGDKRPQLSDLKESGSIEEDSDVVEFIYRAEKYGIMENDKGESTVGVMEIITEKNRQGGSGATEVKFLPTISTIIDKSLTNMYQVNNINDFENQKSIF